MGIEKYLHILTNAANANQPNSGDTTPATSTEPSKMSSSDLTALSMGWGTLSIVADTYSARTFSLYPGCLQI